MRRLLHGGVFGTPDRKPGKISDELLADWQVKVFTGFVKKLKVLQIKLRAIFNIISIRTDKSSATMLPDKIEFTFNAEKTVQTAAMFLKLHGNKPMKYLALLKLLYIADRIALQKIDQPLTGDNYVSMKYGPVLSKVYDFIKDNNIDKVELWKDYITTKSHPHLVGNDYEVRLIKDPGNEELSEEEEEIIIEVYNKYRGYDRFDLAEMTHDFPEWQNPAEADPPRNVIPINIVDILKNVGKSNEEIEYISETAKRQAYLKVILGK